MTDLVEYCVDRLPALLRLLADSDVELLELQDGETRVRVHRTPAAFEEAPDESAEEAAGPLEPVVEYITSPLVGTFYRAGTPGTAPLAERGTRVDGDTVVGYVEVLGESIEVPAGTQGVIVEVRATDGDAVAYGDPLFAVLQGG